MDKQLFMEVPYSNPIDGVNQALLWSSSFLVINSWYHMVYTHYDVQDTGFAPLYTFFYIKMFHRAVDISYDNSI